MGREIRNISKLTIF